MAARSHKNPFLALGFPDDEATVQAWRGDLAHIIREQFRRSGLTQVAYAARLGTQQSVLSPIINGNLRRVSLEFLLKLCVRAGSAGEARWGPSAECARVVERTGKAIARSSSAAPKRRGSRTARTASPDRSRASLAAAPR